MKKLSAFILVVLVSFISVSVQAQIRFGLKGGVNISSVHFNQKLLSHDNVTGFNVGPMMAIMAPYTGLGVDFALLYSQKGMGLRREKDIKNDYLELPVNLKWKFGLPILKIYTNVGPYVNFRIGGDKFWSIPGNTLDQLKSKNFGAGMNFGAGVEVIKHVQVGLNYTLGLTDDYTASKLDLKAKNRCWTFQAAILF